VRSTNETNGEIHERDEVLHNIADLVPYRAYKDGAPERAAIAAAEANFTIAFGAAREGGFDSRQHLQIDGTRHQTSKALAEHSFAVVSGQGQKAVIGKY
jgi:hypothetical protein